MKPQVQSDVARPSSMNKGCSSSQKSASRQSSGTNRTPSSAGSDTNAASRRSLPQKFAPRTFQQRNVMASVNVLVLIFLFS